LQYFAYICATKTGLTLPQSAILAQYRALSAELQVFDHDKYI